MRKTDSIDDDCEQRLVERAAYDPESFRRLYNLYLPRVYAYLSYRVGSASDAEDLTAAVFLKVVQQIERFTAQHEGSFAAWIFRIAHNLAGNFQRSHRRAGERLSLDELPEIAANVLLPEDVLLRKELFAMLHALVAGLPARRREVVSLRYFAGLRNREIAAVLGLAERSVAATLSRALTDLEAGLAGWEDSGADRYKGR